MSLLVRTLLLLCVGVGLGTLLGPEKIPVLVGFLSVPSSALSSNAACVGVVAVVGVGCGCVLSVA